MDAEGLKALSAALCMAIGSIAPAIALGMLISKSVESIARQPEAANDIRTSMIIGIGMTEAVALYSFVVALMLIFVA